MDIKIVLTKVETLLTPVLKNMGYELIERELILESGRFVLRLYIDKEGGVTIDDCERVSHGVEDLIEVEEIIPVTYVLEVSSPGINRPLRRREDFERYRGSRIRLKTIEQIDGRMNYKGILEGVEGEEIVMVVDGNHYRIPFTNLAKARIEPDIVPSKGKIN